MIIYVALALLVILLGRVSSRNKLKSNSPQFAFATNTLYSGRYNSSSKKNNFYSKHSIIPVILLIVIFAIRAYSVGADTNNYYSYFLELKNASMNPFIFFSQSSSKEVGYDLLNYVVLLICPNFTFFLFVEALLIFIPLYFVVKRYSIRPELSYFMFIIIGNYFQSFNITRQYICLFILILSLKYVFSNNLFKFIFFVFLGTCFHSSALVFLIIYPIYAYKINLKFIFGVFVFTIIVILLFDPVLKIFSFVMRHDYYSKYGPSSPHMERFALDSLIMIIAFTFVFIILYSCRKNVKLRLPHGLRLYDLFLKMFLLYLSVKFLAYVKGDIIERIGLYFSISLIFLVPMFIESQCRDNKGIMYLALIIVGILFMFYVIYVRGAYTVLPYKTIFSAINF